MFIDLNRATQVEITLINGETRTVTKPETEEIQAVLDWNDDWIRIIGGRFIGNKPADLYIPMSKVLEIEITREASKHGDA